jgi:hypothetical protein
MARRRVDTRAVCEDGEGVFQLVPWDRFDRDHDEERGTVFAAMQQNGTGTLTNQAWITEVKSLHSGADLRIVDVGQPVTFDAFDRLVGAAQVSTPLTTTPAAIPPGVAGGGSPIVGLEVPGEGPELQVKLAWQCDSDPNGWTDVTPSATGYVVNLGALGCKARQKLTITPRPTNIGFALYGNPNWEMAVGTRDVTNGRAFLLQDGPVLVRGTLVSYNAVEAVVDLEEVSMDGAPACNPGTYTFRAL